MKRLTQTERNKIQAELLKIMEQDKEFTDFLKAETVRIGKEGVIQQIKKAIWEDDEPTYPQQLSDYLD